MEDPRWTIKDKLEQFRGVTTLYKNTNTHVKEKVTVQRKKQTKDIKNLNTQTTKFRNQYEGIIRGDKQNLLPALNAHPTQQLAFKNLKPVEIEEELKQSIFCKNKELDRIRYKRSNLEKTYLNKKLELADIEKETEEAPENYLWEQELANQIQSVSVKLNTARANKIVYEKALNTLKNDAIRFDEVMAGLRNDLEQQCQSIVKAVEMGQSVSEELESLQKEYKDTEKMVRANMKKRDRAIRNLRSEIDHLRQMHGPSGRESRPVLSAAGNMRDSGNLLDDPDQEDMKEMLQRHLKREKTELENNLNLIKNAASVQRIQDICPRIDEQRKQKEWLKKQITDNEEQLAKMLELRNQLDVMLEVVMYHSMTDEAREQEQERDRLREDIKDKEETLQEKQTDLVNIGKKIVEVRSALLTLNIMLDRVWPGAGHDLISSEAMMSLDSDHFTATLGQFKPLTQPNTEALTLMEQVTKKVRWLLDQVETKSISFKIAMRSPHPMASSASKGLRADDEADNIVSDMLDELEDMDDPSVLTRKDIKDESARIVEMYDNPRAMFQDDNHPKYKKHKCF